jgi:hypothetical protein
MLSWSKHRIDLGNKPYSAISLFGEGHRVDDCEGLFRFEAEDSVSKDPVVDFYFTKMEKAKFGARKQVIVGTILGIDGNSVSRSASSAGNDEELILELKSFISVAVAAEEQTCLLEAHKRVGKVSFGPLIRGHDPAIRKGRLVTTDDDVIDSRVPIESFKLT